MVIYKYLNNSQELLEIEVLHIHNDYNNENEQRLERKSCSSCSMTSSDQRMYFLTMVLKKNIISTEKMFMLLYIEYKQQLFDIKNNETEEEQQPVRHIPAPRCVLHLRPSPTRASTCWCSCR